ncbi:MAG: cation diffusion facilitator family transporter [Dorea sp.]|nr:cation diffusion facilitator family transporter [Dorea sp.]
MGILYKLMRQDPESRDGIIAVTSGLNIIANVFIALLKIVIGVITSSVAIISEGVNNASDAMTSILALLGTKLAGKHPDEKHPFGYGRIEYMASLVIAVMILYSSIEIIKSSVHLILHPEEMSVSFASIGIIVLTAVIKIFMGNYTIKMGEKTESSSLTGVGEEGKADSLASLITILSSLVYICFHYSVDGYAGLLIGGLVFKAGAGVLAETCNDLLGKTGDHELATQLYKEIRSTEGIQAAVDMMLHNYGPEAWSGSVNVEMDHKMTVGEIYNILHALQLRIMHEYHVVMVFGVYAVDNDHEEVRALRKKISEFMKLHEHIKSFHAVYIDTDNDTIYCDFIVDYKLDDWEGLRKEFVTYMKEFYPQYKIELVVETEFV